MRRGPVRCAVEIPNVLALRVKSAALWRQTQRHRRALRVIIFGHDNALGHNTSTDGNHGGGGSIESTMRRRVFGSEPHNWHESQQRFGQFGLVLVERTCRVGKWMQR